MTASNAFIYFSGVATSRDSNWYTKNVTVSWVPYHTLSHWVIRSFPSCGVKVLHPAQNDLPRPSATATAPPPKKKKRYVPWSSSRGDWRKASLPTDGNLYIYYIYIIYITGHEEGSGLTAAAKDEATTVWNLFGGLCCPQFWGFPFVWKAFIFRG